MDRLSQLRGEAGGSRDSTLDTTSPPSEAFMTANESSSKYYSLSEVDSTFDISSIKDDISSIKDVSLVSTATESDGTITNTDELISNLSPIGKKSDILDSYKIDTQIEAANILSGGVAIFDDNDNSYDGDELVIDDNVEVDEKTSSELKQSETLEFKQLTCISDGIITEDGHIASKDTEVVLQIDGKQVEAIDIGNGLYLYRKAGQDELAAVQISDDDQRQPSFKFLKVRKKKKRRENAEGNLEVYEEIEIEVPKEVPAKEGKMADKNIPSHVPIMDINKVISESASNKVAERKILAPSKETIVITEEEIESKESSPDNKSEVNLNGKMMKFSESRKSPVIGSFTPMTYHSTPNKEGKPLTKTMVDQQLHTNRNSDLSNVKKTIEVHTDSCKQKAVDTSTKNKDADDNKLNEAANTEKENVSVELNEKDVVQIDEKNDNINEVREGCEAVANVGNKAETKSSDEIVQGGKTITEDIKVIPAEEDNTKEVPMEENIVIDSLQKATEEIPIEANKELQKPAEDKGGEKLKDVSKACTEEIIEIKDSEENKSLKEESNQTASEKVEPTEILCESDEGKEEPMEIDETVLTIAEIVPSFKDSKGTDSTDKVGQINEKQVEITEDKQDHPLIIDEEPILIEDDDVSIVEEVIVENKDEKETLKSQENVTCDSTQEVKLVNDLKDVAITTSNALKQDEDNLKKGVELTEPNKDSNDKIENQVDLSSLDTGLQVNTQKDTKNDQFQSVGSTVSAIESSCDAKKDLPSVQEIKNDLPSKLEEQVKKDLTSTVLEEVKKDLSPAVIAQVKEDLPTPVIEEVKKCVPSVATEEIKKDSSCMMTKEVKMDVPAVMMEAGKKDSSSVIAEEVQKDSSSVIAEEVQKDSSSAVIKECKDVTETSAAIAKEVSKDSIPLTDSKPIQEDTLQDTNATKAASSVAKHSETKELQQQLKETSFKSLIDKLKDVPQPVKETINEIKPNAFASTMLKDAKPKEVGKHNMPTGISPLLEQKHIPFNLPKVIQDKPAVEVKTHLKTAPPIDKKVVNKSDYKMDSKVLDTYSKKGPINLIQVHESKPTVAQIKKDSISVPIPEPLLKDKTHKLGNVIDLQKKVAPPPVKNISIDKPQFTVDSKRSFTSHKDDRKDVKLPPKDIPNERMKVNIMNIEITKVPKVDTTKTNVAIRQDVSSSSSKITVQGAKNKIEPKERKELPRIAEPKPINNNHAAVPFGKWTEANRQEFLNKFKTKTSVTSSSSNQLKNSNDLNRRDVLKKIDSQRQSSNALSKTQEANKINMKPETAAFSNKPNIIKKDTIQESKIPQKAEPVEVKSKPAASKNIAKIEVAPKTSGEPSHTATSASKKEVCQTTGVVQNLIDKTIEGMIHRTTPVPKMQEEPKQIINKESSVPKSTKPPQTYQPIEQATLDAIEMKMNELHGIPFIERPPHELPQVHKTDLKSYSKVEKEKPQQVVPAKTKIPNLLPFQNKNPQKVVKETVIEVDSDDEIIEHEPITGDIELNKKSQAPNLPIKAKLPSNISPQPQQEKAVIDTSKKDAIITEKDFDKFARRNSMTYENCLTVNFDGKEPHNVVETVVEKDPCPKSYSRNESRGESKAKLPYKYQNPRPNTQPAKVYPASKFVPVNDDPSNRNQSKLQKAYHSALTAKRQQAAESPITIIEDQPVKVVFMDSVEYTPSQLNVQGQDLSPAKRAMPESDVTISTCDSLDSDMLDTIDDGKSQDDAKIKTKHQRKQVLTPVDEPELELIEPSDLGIEVSPKKKRKTEDDKADKNLKYPMRKKLYLLGSNPVTEEKPTNIVETLKNPLKETVNLNDNGVAHKNPVSALDSLVKAAELIETQTENNRMLNVDDQPTTPVKRGRGRPRKYPLTPDGTVDKSKVATPSPQKKPRLIDAKVPKRDTLSDDSDSDGEIIKENWTMGKINENIVCPICNKLFRTENVVFKHVKHCTGPSPSRSDSDKRSPRRMRISQDFDTKSSDSKSDDMDPDDDKPLVIRKETPKKRKSKDSVTKYEDKDEVIVIEDTPVKEKPLKIDERKQHESRKPKTKVPHKNNDLVCEFCGKTFRQLSYLVSHKLQHKKQEKVEPKKTEKDAPVVTKSVYSCEVCKKEFRKLHHLVQHRIIHNPVPARSLRKSSSEQSESKPDKEPSTSKQNEDPSAGFRCEPCDKSFRKLHHLVEHRETHDGINRQKTTTAPPAKEEKAVEKPALLHQCDVCKKTFRKLQHLNEHKEQHVETSSEKSDDKSVKSSLSTRDIIHECSLCYMVFPNEHSLNKHTIICQRKKRQSKQTKPADETEGGDDLTGSPPPEDKAETTALPKPIFENTKKDDNIQEVLEKIESTKDKPMAKELEEQKAKPEEPIKSLENEKIIQKLQRRVSEQQVPPTKRDFVETETAKKEAISEVPHKIKKVEEKEPIVIHETPKKKTPLKDKSATKRLKATVTPKPVTEEVKPAVESSDDDEVRYMLNPNFKAEDVTEEKVFMKVRAKKRSSLQIERPNSKDLVKRRTSLQHPPKIPRLKAKVVETNTATIKKEIKTPKLEPVPSTDSDDSETTKYSFPSTIPEKPIKSAQDRTPKETERKIIKKSLADKRKSLSGIAKRKSLGKVVTARHKPASPLKQVKKRTLDVEHRCDCGQLFSSAALLSRHTTLAHTPPRIRRRRSPPPDEKPVIKPPPRKSSGADKPKKSPASRKSSARSDSSTSTNTKPTKSEVKPGRKSQVKDAESSSDSRQAKLDKSEAKSSVKPRRSGAHRGVPVPDKMRKLMQKK